MAKELAKRKDRAEARRHQHAAKKLRMVGAEPGDDAFGITPSITSSTQLLSATLSAQLGEYNEIESQKAKLQEKESENRSALEMIQCAIQFGNAFQKALGAELLSQKLQSLKEKLDGLGH